MPCRIAALNLATDPDDEAMRQTLKWNVEPDSSAIGGERVQIAFCRS